MEGMLDGANQRHSDNDIEDSKRGKAKRVSKLSKQKEWEIGLQGYELSHFKQGLVEHFIGICSGMPTLDSNLYRPLY